MKKELKWFVKEITHLPTVETGWGNGYVALPPEHPYYLKDYDDIPVDVHGGLTFGSLARRFKWEEIQDIPDDYYIIGFDTAHLGDNRTIWTEQDVITETLNLKEQLEKLWK